MAATILGVDVSKKSTEDIENVINTLGLRGLSEKSLKKLNQFPLNMKKNWINNPESTGEFTDESVKNLPIPQVEKTKTPKVRKSMKNTIDEAKIYSSEYADAINKLDKEAYDKACGSYESSEDRQMAHYDNMYDSLKKSNLKLSSKELDFICENVAMGAYANNQKAHAFFKNAISVENGKELSDGGKFIMFYTGTKDVGTLLETKISDIEDAVGEKLGLPDSKHQSVFITPSSDYADGKAFAVIYSDEIPHDANKVIRDAIKDELKITNPDLSVATTITYPLLDTELASVQKKYSNKALGLNKEGQPLSYDVPKFNSNDYNIDGYDETGHSADGDYNAMYDNAYTDQGPDL